MTDSKKSITITFDEDSPKPSTKDMVAALTGTMTTDEIAKVLRLKRNTVRKYQWLADPERGRMRLRPRTWRYDWDAVDWAGKTNLEIARELGCAASAVATTRRRQGRPAAPDRPSEKEESE